MSKTMTELVYSIDGELYQYDDINKCIQEYVDGWLEDERKVGEVGSVWQGEPVRADIRQYLPTSIVEMIRENLYEDYVDYCEYYLVEHEEGIDEAVKKAVVEYCDEHKCHPYFYLVKNDKEIKFRITSVNEYNVEWERI